MINIYPGYFIVFREYPEKLFIGLMKSFHICGNMHKSHTDFNTQHTNHNDGKNSISLIFINCSNNHFIWSFCCATTETRQQIKLENKNNNCKTRQLHNLLWESVILCSTVHQITDSIKLRKLKWLK